MKRCPQCLFLYPESDEKCDFDQTPLEVVDDAEIERATSPLKPRRRALPVAVAVGLLLALVVFAIYYGLNKRTPTTSAATQTSVTVEPSPIPSATPAPSPPPTVSPSPSPSPKTSSNGVATAHTRASTDPVSTSGPGMGTRQGSKPVIVLTSGGKIDADEVWRTRDGVWYRRNGMVTLLKHNQVKSIASK
jgi:hypothetical protein